MKRVFNLLFVLLALTATSCKKDKIKSVDSKKIGGEYEMYEIEDQVPFAIGPLPDQNGNGGSIIVTQKNDSTAKVEVVAYDKNHKEVDRESFGDSRVIKDSDGEVTLVDKVGRLAFIYGDYKMDFYGYDNQRLGAKRK